MSLEIFRHPYGRREAGYSVRVRGRAQQAARTGSSPEPLPLRVLKHGAVQSVSGRGGRGPDPEWREVRRTGRRWDEVGWGETRLGPFRLIIATFSEWKF